MSLLVVMMIMAAVFAIAVPIGGSIIWVKKNRVSFKPVLIGALVFLVMVYVLENLVHVAVLRTGTPIGDFILSNWVVYAVYAGLMAGIFEETGRKLAFTTLLKRSFRKEDAVAYGFGHGGVEVVLVLGMTYIVLLMALFTNGAGELSALLPTLQSLTPGLVLMAIIERVFALTFHICMSILVWISVKDTTKRWYFPLAIALHAFLDFPAAMYQMGVIPIWAVEAYVGIFVILVLWRVMSVYNNRLNEGPELW